MQVFSLYRNLEYWSLINDTVQTLCKFYSWHYLKVFSFERYFNFIPICTWRLWGARGCLVYWLILSHDHLDDYVLWMNKKSDYWISRMMFWFVFQTRNKSNRIKCAQNKFCEKENISILFGHGTDIAFEYYYKLINEWFCSIKEWYNNSSFDNLLLKIQILLLEFYALAQSYFIMDTLIFVNKNKLMDHSMIQKSCNYSNQKNIRSDSKCLILIPMEDVTMAKLANSEKSQEFNIGNMNLFFYLNMAPSHVWVYHICTLFIYYSLYQKIDFANFECLNESEEDSGKRVFRPWENRLDKNSSDCVTSDCDAELLFNIPFTGNVKLKVCS